MSRGFSGVFWTAGMLALTVAFGCGGSSRRDAEPESPLSGGGAVDESPPGAAGSSTSGGNGAAPSHEGGSSAVGGSSLGGSPAGGASPGGAAGDAGGPPLSLPAGCRARISTETSELCSLAVDCDESPSLATYCHRLDSGSWECQCSIEDRMYRVENAGNLQACALAVTLCADETPTLGDESCERSNQTADVDDCKVDIDCRTPIELEPDTETRAWLVRAGWTHCHRWQPATSFNCEFFDGKEKSSSAIGADSGEDVCGPLTDVYLTGDLPGSGGKKYCASGLSNVESQSCTQVASCGVETPIADGVRLFSQVEQREASCQASAGGGSECYCIAGDSVFEFALSTAPDEDTCTSAALNCTADPVIEPEGDPRCKGQPVDTSDELSCSQSFKCDQDMTLDGRNIVAHGRIGLMCRRWGLGTPWVCSCGTDGNAIKLALGAADAGPDEACGLASAECLEQLSPHMGLRPEYLDVPDPVVYLSGAP